MREVLYRILKVIFIMAITAVGGFSAVALYGLGRSVITESVNNELEVFVYIIIVCFALLVFSIPSVIFQIKTFSSSKQKKGYSNVLDVEYEEESGTGLKKRSAPRVLWISNFILSLGLLAISILIMVRLSKDNSPGDSSEWQVAFSIMISLFFVSISMIADEVVILSNNRLAGRSA